MTSLPSLSNPLSLITSQLLSFLTLPPPTLMPATRATPYLTLSKEEQLHKKEVLLASQ